MGGAQITSLGSRGWGESGGGACSLGSRGRGEESGGGACSLDPGERRAAEARAHGQQSPAEDESETRHKTKKAMILSVPYLLH